MVDDAEYEVWAPEGCFPGEMVAMDIYSNPASLPMSKSNESIPQIADKPEDSPKEEVRESPESQHADVDGIGDQRLEVLGAGTNISEASDGADSVATDAILIPVEIPDGCVAGETFFAEVNGVEYEILVPEGCKAGHLIYLEIPAKHAIGRFVADSDKLTVPEIAAKESQPEQHEQRESSGPSENLFAEVRVPEGAVAGSNFVALIEDTEFEVPVPAAWPTVFFEVINEMK